MLSFKKSQIEKENISWKDFYNRHDYVKYNCILHQNTSFELSHLIPNLIIVLKETDENCFNKYQFSDFGTKTCEEFPNYLQCFHDYREFKIKTKVTNQLNISNPDSIDSFFAFLFSWKNTTFLIQDDIGTTFDYIEMQVIKHGLTPNTFFKGSKIFALEIKSLHTRFLNSNNFIQGSEYELAKQQNIDFEMLFFPYSLNDYERYNYCGDLPDFNYFIEFSDSENDIQCKQLFYNKLPLKDWDFKTKLIQITSLKIDLLCKSLCSFILDCFELQNELKQNLEIKNSNFTKVIHLFQSNIASFPSFIYNIFKAYYLLNEEIFSVMNEYGFPMKKSSKFEYECSKFLEFEHPDYQYRFTFNHAKGQKYFFECIPDLYSFLKKEAVFLNGCYIHGHINCLDNCNASNSSTNYTQKSYEQLNIEFENKILALKQNNPELIKEVKVIWQCYFNNTVKSSDTYQKFSQHFKTLSIHPLQRLKPRTCVRGGFLGVYALKWTLDEHPNENFYCLDINGLYSYVATKFAFVIGKYEILIGSNIKKIELINNRFFYNHQKMYGSILLTILPPKSLNIPFLPFRLNNNKTVYTLCLKCSENSNKKQCNHSDFERSFTSSYMINEIEFSLTLGYQIIEIHECHFYKRQKSFLKNFVNHLNYLKMINSDFLSKESINKDMICDTINKELELPANLQISSNIVTPNLRKKNLYKLAANALFGKLQQRNDYLKSYYASSQIELEDLYFKYLDQIENIKCHQDSMCELFVKPDPLKIGPNRNANCYVGAQITSFARQVIYEHIQTLENKGATIFYVDTDSIFFSLNNTIPIPLKISECLGHFKHVYSNPIKSFHCLGSKNYLISYLSKNNLEICCKVKGLSLQAKPQNDLNIVNLYDSYLDSFFKSITCTKTFAQTRIKRSKKLYHLTSIEQRTFSNTIDIERILFSNEIYFSKPYGFNKE